MATVALEALAVTAEHLEDPLLERFALILGNQFAGRNQKRRIADDARLAVDHPDEAIEGLETVLLSGLATSFCSSGGSDVKQALSQAESSCTSAVSKLPSGQAQESLSKLCDAISSAE